MTLMEKLKIFVVKEPIVAASCLIGGVGLFLPAMVKPMLDSFESSKQVSQPALNDVVAGMTGKISDDIKGRFPPYVFKINKSTIVQGRH